MNGMDRSAIIAVTVGTAGIGLLYYTFGSDLPWWFYLIVWLGGMGSGFGACVQHEAYKTIVEKKDR